MANTECADRSEMIIIKVCRTILRDCFGALMVVDDRLFLMLCSSVMMVERWMDG